MNGSLPQTEAYSNLLELAGQARPIVEHSSFPELFRSTLLPELAKEGYALLERFLSNSDLMAYDRSMAAKLNSREPLLITGGQPFDWLKDMGAIETRASLKALVDHFYAGSKLDAQHVRTLRTGMKRLMDEVVSHCADDAEFGAKLVTMALETKSVLIDAQHREIDGLLEEAAAGVDRISRSEDIAEKTLGKIGDLELAKYYAEFAGQETTSANDFRKLTVRMVLAATGMTLAFVVVPATGIGWLDIEPGDYVNLIQRTVFVGAVFALGGYFARQANQHRALANWGSSLAVQLRTFDAYLAAIENPDVRDDLRKSFGARVFGEHPPMKGEPAVTPSAAAMDTAVGWAAKLTGGGK